jgi:hypothetical protein
MQATVLGLGLLAGVALWLSSWPRPALALPALLTVISLWRMRRLPRGQLVMHASGRAEWWPEQTRTGIAVEPSAAERVELESRGLVLVLSARVQGRIVRWPLASDTLPGPQTRALRLWIDRHAQAASPALPPSSS